MCWILMQHQLSAQVLDWYQIEENKSEFGFVGYKGARKNVAIDGSGNSITCAPFGDSVYVANQLLTATFETVLVKRDVNGNVIWSRTLNGTGFKSGHSIHADSIGNVYVLGWYYGNASIAGTNLYSYGNYDCFLVKLNASGQIIYIKNFGSAGYDYPFALDTDPTGSVYVTGKFAFNLQFGTSSLSGAANSHFLFKLDPSGNMQYLRNICQNGASDWGRGDISRSSNGKLAVVSNFTGTSTFQNETLNGGGGYLAILAESSGDLDTVLRAGSQAHLLDHEAGGNIIVCGVQSASTDSVANYLLPNISGGNRYYLAKMDPSGLVQSVRVMNRANSTFSGLEGFRALHVSRAGQIYLSGEFERPFEASPGASVPIQFPMAQNRTKALLIKLNEGFVYQWSMCAASSDTLSVPNSDLGCGIYTDGRGNILWSTMNDASSVMSTGLKQNTDTSLLASLQSRFGAHGIHLWKFSEPSIETGAPDFLAYCPGDSLHIPYTKFGEFDAGNYFRLELSDSLGGFTHPIVLDSLQDSSSGIFHSRFPLGLSASPRYRLRVNASHPEIFGTFTQNPVQIRGIPLADAGTDAFFCLGDTVQIQATGGGSYSWDGFGMLGNTDSAILFVIPDGDRAYHVRVQDSISSCYQFDTVELRFRRAVVLDSISDTLVCHGELFERTAHVLEGDSSLSYRWTNQGFLLSDADTFAFQPLNEETIQLWSWDACSVSPDSFEFVVKVRPALNLGALSDTLVCNNSILNWKATAEGGDSTAYQFRWYTPDFNTLLQVGKSFDSIFQQSTSIALHVTDGCSQDNDSLIVQVNVAPLPSLHPPDSVLLCQGDTIVLRVQADTGYSAFAEYSWDGQPFITADSFKFLPVQSIWVPAQVRDVCMNTDTDSIRVFLRSPLNLTVRTDTIICNGESLVMFVSGAETDTAHYSFFWNQASSSDNYYEVVPDRSAFYKVRIQNNCDLSNTNDSVWIQVRDSLSVQWTSSNPYCYGESVLMQPVLSGGWNPGYSLVWKDETGIEVENGFFYEVEVRDSLKLRMVLHDGCTTDGDSIEVQLKSAARLNITVPSDTLLCRGQELRLNWWISGGAGAGRTIIATPFDSTALSNGIFPTASQQVFLELWDGCSDTAYADFRIDLRDSLLLDKMMDTALCEGDLLAVPLQAKGGIASNYTYKWNGISANPLNIKDTITQDTQWVFCVSDGCSAPDCDSISIISRPLPDASIAWLDSPWCAPGVFQMEAIDQRNNLQYQWSLPGLLNDTISDKPNLSFEINKAGNYTAKLEITDAEGCSSESKLIPFTVNPKPNAFFQVGDSVKILGEPIRINLQDQSIVKNVWSEVNIDSLGPYTFTWWMDDTATIQLEHIAWNRFGCSDTFSRGLRIKDKFECFIPNVISLSGIQPENRVFGPVCSEMMEMRMRIYNRWGQLIFESSVPGETWDGRGRQGEAIPDGVYLYHIEVKNEYLEVLRFEGTITLLH